MSSTITTVLRRNSDYDYSILNESGNSIGRVTTGNVHRKFYVFLDGIYFGLNGVPNRRGGSTMASVSRLKDVPDFVVQTLVTIADVDAKFDADKKVLNETLIKRQAQTLPHSWRGLATHFLPTKFIHWM